MLALALAALLGAAAPAPEPPAPAAPDRATLVQAARELMNGAHYCTMVTIGEDGAPSARVVDPFPPEEDMTVWIATRPSTRKVAEIRRDPRVTLLWYDPERQGFATLTGRAELVDDPAEKARRWKASWKGFYQDENRGPDYLLVRVRPVRLEVLSPAHGVLNDPGTWRAPSVELGPARP